MGKRVQRLRHGAAQAATFVGLQGEITVDTDANAIHVHDGVTAGGTEGAKADASNIQAATNSQDGKATASQITQLETNVTDIAKLKKETGGYVKNTISGNHVLSAAHAENLIFEFDGSLAADADITFPDETKLAVIVNATSGGFDLIIKTPSGASWLTVPNGVVRFCYIDEVFDTNGLQKLAAAIDYDNGVSGFTATNVQDVIDEIETTFLKLTGGVMTGNVQINHDAPQITLKTNLAVGVPTFYLKDSNGNTRVTINNGTSGVNGLQLSTYDNTGTEQLRVQFREDGLIYRGTGGAGGTFYELWDAGNQGAGSNMDSDLLDGEEGSFYTNAGNLDAGSVPTARFGANTVPPASMQGNRCQAVVFDQDGVGISGFAGKVADQYSTTTGEGTYALPHGTYGNLSFVIAHLYGAGGGAGGVTASISQNAASAAGGSGAYSRKIIDIRDIDFAPADVNTGTNIITFSAGHNKMPNDVVQFDTDDTLPAGLSVLTDYFVITSGFSGTTMKVATSKGGSEVDITSQGAGNHTCRITELAHDIGAGGAGGTTGTIDGSDGGTTYSGNATNSRCSAGGGKGGDAASNNAGVNSTTKGDGGVAANGDFNLPGNVGNHAFSDIVAGNGPHAPGPLGGSIVKGRINDTSDGDDGIQPGGGGGGAHAFSAGIISKIGGAGADGMIHYEIFAS